MKINVSQKHIYYLLKLVMTDLKRMDDLADHAVCHGAEVYLPDHDMASQVRFRLLDGVNAKS